MSRSETATAWIANVENFWFNEVGEAGWFKANPAVDEIVRTRFLAIHEQAAAEFDLATAIRSAERVVANVIVLDQFPRNMFRGTPRGICNRSSGLGHRLRGGGARARWRARQAPPPFFVSAVRAQRSAVRPASRGRTCGPPWRQQVAALRAGAPRHRCAVRPVSTPQCDPRTTFDAGGTGVSERTQQRVLSCGGFSVQLRCRSASTNSVKAAED